MRDFQTAPLAPEGARAVRSGKCGAPLGALTEGPWPGGGAEGLGEWCQMMAVLRGASSAHGGSPDLADERLGLRRRG